jgi:hypothetical protein
MIPAFRMQWCSALPSPFGSAERIVTGKGREFEIFKWALGKKGPRK